MTERIPMFTSIDALAPRLPDRYTGKKPQAIGSSSETLTLTL
jgi:hypothetical protein